MKTKLYGRRILHVLSPVRFNGRVFDHAKDSNYKCTERFISWLPDCHHYILVPEQHTIVDNRRNVTLLPYNYPTNAVSNRSQFDTKSFLNAIDVKNMDFDFLFVNQPELLYNVLVALMDKRYGEILHRFSFFHWIDCPASRGSPAIPHGYMRQLEAINLSDKVFVHSSETIRYLLTNFKKSKSVKLDLEYIASKTEYMPTAIAPFGKEQPIDLPKGKKIVVFNHRWSQSTGMNRFLEYTEKLKDKYLFWVTDKDAEVPDGYKTSNLNYGQYQYLLKNSYCSVCFVDDYATWNLSVQDGISLGKPVLAYNHPIMESILGKDYPYTFETADEFERLLEKLPNTIDWKLPNHDEVFKTNLIKSMESCLRSTENTPKDARAWAYYILNGFTHKSAITEQVQPNIGLNSVWQYIRRWLLMNGFEDDPNSPYPSYSIKKGEETKLKKLIEGLNLVIRPIERKKPIITKKDNPFF